jgi:hypothetical protein
VTVRINLEKHSALSTLTLEVEVRVLNHIQGYETCTVSVVFVFPDGVSRVKECHICLGVIGSCVRQPLQFY